ncbi:MAG: hypothetical protein WCE82_06420 [Halobacteriota archaeon]
MRPQVVVAMLPLLDGRPEEEAVFKQLLFQRWLKQNEIRLLLSNVHIVNGDLRKFAEQHSDVIQWEHSNRAYILTHGVSGVDWRFYKHPLPDSVYAVYMEYWGDVSLKI